MSEWMPCVGMWMGGVRVMCRFGGWMGYVLMWVCR